MSRRRRTRRRRWSVWAALFVLFAMFTWRTTQSSSPADPRDGSAADESRPSVAVRAFAWNVNRGVGTEPDASLGAVTRLLGAAADADIWALSEVDPGWFDAIDAALEGACGCAVDGYRGTSGRVQRLGLMWRSDRFDAIEVSELGRVNVDGYGRAPIAALLRDKIDGSETLWVTVHFRRANADARSEEAEVLGALLRELDLPTVVFGDTNMDCPLDGGACDRAHERLLSGGFLRWLPPDEARATTCRSERGNMLDLVFVGGAVASRDAHASVLDRATFCDAAMGDGSHVPITIVLDQPTN